MLKWRSKSSVVSSRDSFYNDEVKPPTEKPCQHGLDPSPRALDRLHDSYEEPVFLANRHLEGYSLDTFDTVSTAQPMRNSMTTQKMLNYLELSPGFRRDSRRNRKKRPAAKGSLSLPASPEGLKQKTERRDSNIGKEGIFTRFKKMFSKRAYRDRRSKSLPSSPKASRASVDSRWFDKQLQNSHHADDRMPTRLERLIDSKRGQRNSFRREGYSSSSNETCSSPSSVYKEGSDISDTSLPRVNQNVRIISGPIHTQASDYFSRNRSESFPTNGGRMGLENSGTSPYQRPFPVTWTTSNKQPKDKNLRRHTKSFSHDRDGKNKQLQFETFQRGERGAIVQEATMKTGKRRLSYPFDEMNRNDGIPTKPKTTFTIPNEINEPQEHQDIDTTRKEQKKSQSGTVEQVWEMCDSNRKSLYIPFIDPKLIEITKKSLRPCALPGQKNKALPGVPQTSPIEHIITDAHESPKHTDVAKHAKNNNNGRGTHRTQHSEHFAEESKQNTAQKTSPHIKISVDEEELEVPFNSHSDAMCFVDNLQTPTLKFSCVKEIVQSLEKKMCLESPSLTTMPTPCAFIQRIPSDALQTTADEEADIRAAAGGLEETDSRTGGNRNQRPPKVDLYYQSNAAEELPKIENDTSKTDRDLSFMGKDLPIVDMCLSKTNQDLSNTEKDALRTGKDLSRASEELSMKDNDLTKGEEDQRKNNNGLPKTDYNLPMTDKEMFKTQKALPEADNKYLTLAEEGSPSIDKDLPMANKDIPKDAFGALEYSPLQASVAVNIAEAVKNRNAIVDAFDLDEVLVASEENRNLGSNESKMEESIGIEITPISLCKTSGFEVIDNPSPTTLTGTPLEVKAIQKAACSESGEIQSLSSLSKMALEAKRYISTHNDAKNLNLWDLLTHAKYQSQSDISKGGDNTLHGVMMENVDTLESLSEQQLSWVGEDEKSTKDYFASTELGACPFHEEESPKRELNAPAEGRTLVDAVDADIARAESVPNRNDEAKSSTIDLFKDENDTYFEVEQYSLLTEQGMPAWLRDAPNKCIDPGNQAKPETKLGQISPDESQIVCGCLNPRRMSDASTVEAKTNEIPMCEQVPAVNQHKQPVENDRTVVPFVKVNWVKEAETLCVQETSLTYSKCKPTSLQPVLEKMAGEFLQPTDATDGNVWFMMPEIASASNTDTLQVNQNRGSARKVHKKVTFDLDTASSSLSKSSEDLAAIRCELSIYPGICAESSFSLLEETTTYLVAEPDRNFSLERVNKVDGACDLAAGAVEEKIIEGSQIKEKTNTLVDETSIGKISHGAKSESLTSEELNGKITHTAMGCCGLYKRGKKDNAITDALQADPSCRNFGTFIASEATIVPGELDHCSFAKSIEMPFLRESKCTGACKIMGEEICTAEKSADSCVHKIEMQYPSFSNAEKKITAMSSRAASTESLCEHSCFPDTSTTYTATRGSAGELIENRFPSEMFCPDGSNPGLLIDNSTRAPSPITSGQDQTARQFGFGAMPEPSPTGQSPICQPTWPDGCQTHTIASKHVSTPAQGKPSGAQPTLESRKLKHLRQALRVSGAHGRAATDLLSSLSLDSCGDCDDLREEISDEVSDQIVRSLSLAGPAQPAPTSFEQVKSQLKNSSSSKQTERREYSVSGYSTLSKHPSERNGFLGPQLSDDNFKNPNIKRTQSAHSTVKSYKSSASKLSRSAKHRRCMERSDKERSRTAMSIRCDDKIRGQETRSSCTGARPRTRRPLVTWTDTPTNQPGQWLLLAAFLFFQLLFHCLYVK